MYGHQHCVAIHIIPQVPQGASLKTFEIASLLSIETQPERTYRSCQHKCMYALSSFNIVSLFVRIQSRISLRTASLLVRDAISDLLNTFPMMLSKVRFCGLGVRGKLMLEDTAAEIGVVGVEDGFAAQEGVDGGFADHEKSPNWTREFCFLGSIIILFFFS